MGPSGRVGPSSHVGSFVRVGQFGLVGPFCHVELFGLVPTLKGWFGYLATCVGNCLSRLHGRFLF